MPAVVGERVTFSVANSALLPSGRRTFFIKSIKPSCLGSEESHSSGRIGSALGDCPFIAATSEELVLGSGAGVGPIAKSLATELL